MPEIGEKVEGTVEAVGRASNYKGSWGAGVKVGGKWYNTIGGTDKEALAPLEGILKGDAVRIAFTEDGNRKIIGKIEKTAPPKIEGKEDYRDYQKRIMDECLKDAEGYSATDRIAIAFFNKRCCDKFYYERLL